MKAELFPIARIIVDPRNPRTDFIGERREQLIASIRMHGIKCPLIAYVAGNNARLIDGHCRLDAAKSLEWTEVPVVLFPEPPSEADLLCAQLTINGHRTALNPLDEYEAFVRLAKLKQWNASELATALAVSNAEVTRTLSIGKLSIEERKLVREGKLSKSSAYALSRVPPEQRASLLPKLLAGEVTRDQLNVVASRKKTHDFVKMQKVNLAIPSGLVTVQTVAEINLGDLIELLERLAKEGKKARKQGLDLTTVVRVFRDRVRAQSGYDDSQSGAKADA